MAKVNAALFLKICDEIAGGKSLRQACTDHGISPAAFHLWKNQKDTAGELAERYASAREEQAHSAFEEMADLERKVLDREIEPQAFRAVVDCRRWRLAKMLPREYGDRQQVEHDGRVEIELVRKKSFEEDSCETQA